MNTSSQWTTHIPRESLLECRCERVVYSVRMSRPRGCTAAPLADRLARSSTRDLSSKRVKGKHCLICSLSLSGYAYPSIGVRQPGDMSGPKMKSTHRVAWELTYGPIPKGLMVLHYCDRPRCVEPRHLRLGTHKENMADRKQRGTFSRDILTPQQRATVQRETGSVEGLAEKYGVTAAYIYYQVKRKRICD